MQPIMKNTWLIFKRNKDFIFTITIQPVIIFFLMSFMLSYSTTYKVAVLNKDAGPIGQQITDTFGKMEGFDLMDLSEDEVTAKLLSGTLELAVVVGENNTELVESTGTVNIELVSLGSSEIEETVKLIVNQIVTEAKTGKTIDPSQINFEANTVKSKWITISNSLGFMIFKIVTSSNLLAALIINERNNKMKDRIMLSGVSTNKYLGGMGIIYMLCMMVGSVVYYLAALLLNFDFGMRYTIGFLIMLFAANVLSVTLYLLTSTLVNTNGTLWFMQVLILMPMGLLSGALFPFHLMPAVIQKIANCFPFRWVIGGIENMQKNGDIISALPNIALILAFSLVLYLLAVYRTKQINQKVQ